MADRKQGEEAQHFPHGITSIRTPGVGRHGDGVIKPVGKTEQRARRIGADRVAISGAADWSGEQFEERMWSVVVDDDLVVDPGGLEGPTKGSCVFRRDLRIGPAEEAQNRAAVGIDQIQWRAEVTWLLLDDPPVEADDASEVKP